MKAFLSLLKTAILGVFIFSGFAAFTQSPDLMNYQAVLRDDSGNLITSGTVSMRFTVTSESVDGTTVYQEVHSAAPSSYGVVNLAIGDGTVTEGSFANINWSATGHFITVEIDPDGGSNYESLGSSQFKSVPYAKQASAVDGKVHATGGSPLHSQGAYLEWNPAGLGRTHFVNQKGVGDGGFLWSEVDAENNFTNRMSLGQNGPQFFGNGTDFRIDVGFLGGSVDPNWTTLDMPGNKGIYFWDDLATSGKLKVESGVIQRGGSTIEATLDLGLYSRVPENNMRFVTNNANLLFHTQEGADGIGGNLRLAIEENGNLNHYWVIRNAGIDPGLHADIDNFGQLGRSDVRLFQVYASTYFGTNTSIQSISDQSLKTNVEPLSEGMQQLMELKPVGYDFIPEKLYPNKESRDKMDDKDFYNQMGFIAQEVEKVFPGLVKDMVKEDGTVLKTVGYSGLIPIMVQGMQEQQREIEELKAMVQALMEGD